MRKIIFHTIVVMGAFSNAITMMFITKNTAITMITTALYVVLFEGIFIYMQPRLITADRKRNLRKYPMLKKLIDAKRAVITMTDGTTYYNAEFIGYHTPKDIYMIEIQLHIQKQAKKNATVESKRIDLRQIKEVKPIK